MKPLCGALLVLSLLALADAQSVSIIAPADQFVTPGERLTLSFEVETDEAVDLDVIVLSELGWRIDVPPERVSVAPDVVTRVDLEVDVPDDAPAFALERVTLRLVAEGIEAQGQAELSVLEVLDLRLQAPTQAGTGDATLRVTVTNAGNSVRSPLVELLLVDDERVLATRSVTLAPAASAEVVFDLAFEGPHQVRLRSDRGIDAERPVSVARFGTPEPPPFALRAQLTAGYEIDDGPFASARVRGPLSDFGSVDVLVDAPNWRRSYAGVTFEQGSVRIGATGSAPFRLDLPREVGVLVTYDSDGVGVGGMIGVTANDRLAAYGAASYSAGGASIALGGGVREDDTVASLVASYRDTGWNAGLTARYRQERVDVRLTGDVRDAVGTTSLRLELRDGLSTRARVDTEARYRTGPTAVYAFVSTPVGDAARWDWRAGLTHTLDVDIPGSMSVALQGGLRESFGRVTYRPDLGGGWSSTTTAGVRYDTVGFGITLDTNWAWRGDQTFSIDQRTSYYPSVPRFNSTTRVRVGLFEDPVSLDLSGTWNYTSRSVSVDAALGVGDDSWQLDVDGGARYAYGRTSDQWSYTASVALTYSFDIQVSDGISDATGGRRVGTLIGVVMVGGTPLPDVVVSVGRFRAISDADGRFELTLAPSSYRVSLDRSTLPAGVAFADGTTATVDVVLRETSEVVFEGVRSE